MPRVLITTSTLPRHQTDPEPRFVLDLTQHLPSDWEPLILAPAYPGAAPEELLDGVPVRRYRYAPLARWETLCYPGSILARIQQQPGLLGLVPGLLTGLWLAVAKALKCRPYDCVHAHWFFPQGAVHALSFSAHRHPPLVITSHGGDLGLTQRWPLLRSQLGRILHRAAAITVVAPGMKDMLGTSGYPIDIQAVRVIPMGADLKRFRPELRDPDWPRRQGLLPPVILSVGRLVEKKGFGIMIEAFSRLVRDRQHPTLAICGEGPLADTLKRQAQVLGLADRVHFLGALPHPELAIAYASSDIYCAPSIAAADGDMEGMPTVLAEAAASGLPLIGSRIAGIPLIIEHERTGLLVPSGDVVALAATMQRLVNDAELRCRLGASALTKAQDFAWPRIAEDYARVYAEACNVHKQRSTA